MLRHNVAHSACTTAGTRQVKGGNEAAVDARETKFERFPMCTQLPSQSQRVRGLSPRRPRARGLSSMVWPERVSDETILVDARPPHTTQK